MAVVIETTIGDFTVDLFTKERPQSKLQFMLNHKFVCFQVSTFCKKNNTF